MKKNRNVQIAIPPHARHSLNILAARLSIREGRSVPGWQAAERAILETLQRVEMEMGMVPERIDQATGATK